MFAILALFLSTASLLSAQALQATQLPPGGTIGPTTPTAPIPGSTFMAHQSSLAQGSLVILQPNFQTYAVENQQLIVTWQPVDPTVALSSLPPNLVIEVYPEVPILVGGPFGFVDLVRTDRGEYRRTIPKGWAGEQWNVILREQGGSVVVAGQRFAIKPEGTPLAPTTNLAGNNQMRPGNPNGWPVPNPSTASSLSASNVSWWMMGVAMVLGMMMV